MKDQIKGRQSRAVKRFQSKAPEQHQLLMSLLAQAGSKLEENGGFGKKWKDANKRWLEGCEQQKIEFDQQRRKKTLTWNTDLLRIRSISPRPSLQSPPYKIVKIQNFKSHKSSEEGKCGNFSDMRMIPIKIIDKKSSKPSTNCSDADLTTENQDESRTKTTNCIGTTNNDDGEKRMHPESTERSNEKRIKNLFNKMDCYPELKTVIYRSSSRDIFSTELSLGCGDRSSLRLDLPAPSQNRESNKTVPPTPKPMFNSPFFRTISEKNNCGDRSSLRLDLPAPSQNRDSNKTVLPTPKPMFNSPFFRTISEKNNLDNNRNSDVDLLDKTTTVPSWKVDFCSSKIDS